VLELLQLEKSFYGTVTRGNGDAHIAASVFARLLALPDETVLRVIALVMAETLAAGSVLAEAAGMVIKPDVARLWRLDDTFLDLLKDRTVINALCPKSPARRSRMPTCPRPARCRRRSSVTV
jgi:ParB family transcriptional regulator, chromosome partitioning protein